MLLASPPDELLVLVLVLGAAVVPYSIETQTPG
jgi:hypothetical protein